MRFDLTKFEHGRDWLASALRLLPPGVRAWLHDTDSLGRFFFGPRAGA